MIKTQYLYNAKITNVVDGDTVDAEVDLGFTVYVKVRFRLYGIDTMETNDKAIAVRELGLKAKAFVANALLGKLVTIESHKSDKYGRWLGEIYLDGVSVNKQLLSEGLAVEYFGGTKNVQGI
jgi:micrococcal nuclease